MKRPTYIIIFILITIVGLTIAQIGIGNKIATAGSELSKLQSEVSEYDRRNTILQEKILDISSYTNISKKAGELGYAPYSSKSEIVLSNTLPLAYKQ